MENRDKIVYWIATGLLSLMMLGNVGLYLFQTELATATFASLGYPTTLVYPLAIAKALGVAAILSRRSAVLTEWAYAGFFFDFVLALMAHLTVGDGQFAGAAVAIVLVLVSRIFEPRVFGRRFK
ncbi:MAG: DoxX family protein [Chloroflexota bacterium]